MLHRLITTGADNNPKGCFAQHISRAQRAIMNESIRAPIQQERGCQLNADYFVTNLPSGHS